MEHEQAVQVEEVTFELDMCDRDVAQQHAAVEGDPGHSGISAVLQGTPVVGTPRRKTHWSRLRGRSMNQVVLASRGVFSLTDEGQEGLVILKVYVPAEVPAVAQVQILDGAIHAEVLEEYG